MARSNTRTNGDSSRSGYQPTGGLLLGVGIFMGIGIMALITALGGDEDARESPADPSLTKAVQRMTDRLEKLSGQQNEIVRRMTDLELAMIGSPSTREVMPIGVDDSNVELAELRDLVTQLASPPVSEDGLARGPIVDQVIEAMQYIDQEEEADREAQRDERRQERMERELEDLTEMLGLDANQQLAIQNLLADARAKRAALDDEISSRNERRDARDVLREETKATVASFLSPAQIQLLEENGGLDTRDDRGGGRGRGRGR